VFLQDLLFDYISSDLKVTLIPGVSGSWFPSSPAVKRFDSKFLFRADAITFAAKHALWASSVPRSFPSEFDV